LAADEAARADLPLVMVHSTHRGCMVYQGFGLVLFAVMKYMNNCFSAMQKVLDFELQYFDDFNFVALTRKCK
jgi:hypothetical protein